jgi:hypothetical protein
MAYSSEILEASPDRATKLLNGIGAVATIRTLLADAGMTDQVIIEGRDLLFACLAAPRGPTAVLDTDEAKAQRSAVAELDQWDEPNFGRYGATLTRHHPAAGAFVFFELAASTGIRAVHGIATLLTRIDALEGGTDPDRSATKKDDKKAVELLATRGLDKAERARLRKLVNVALGPTAVLPEQPASQAKEQRIEALTKLREWYDEWAAAARAVVKKKSYRIRLGLASRKAPVRKTKATSGDGNAVGNGSGKGTK